MINDRLLVKLSQMYYEQDKSQKEISEALGISRAQISRLLKKAREENIVTIQINDPSVSETSLEKALIKRYGLTDAVVINTAGIAMAQQLEEFGRLAGPRLDHYIKDRDIVGIMSGRTISQLIQGIGSFPRKNLKILPLVGGIGSRNSSWQANSIAEVFASKTNSTSYTLNAPSVLQSEAARDLMVNEPEISSLLKMGTVCDVSIVGIGAAAVGSSNVIAGALTQEDIEKLKQIGAVGSICISYYDRVGKLLHPEIESRMIGQSIDSISNSKVIAVAIGEEKIIAIDTALKNGYVDVFITNVETAQHIIDQENEEEPR